MSKIETASCGTHRRMLNKQPCIFSMNSLDRNLTRRVKSTDSERCTTSRIAVNIRNKKGT